MRDEVQRYFGGKLYLYVPNLCNARCSFCHVAPTFATSARLPEESLQGVERVLENARAAGFTEVKVTGGEPLLFSNATSLFELFRAAGLRYSVLTNGIDLGRFVDYFKGHRPAQLIVSLHSHGRNAEMFGVDRPDVEQLLDVIGDLARSDVRTTVTSVITKRSVDSSKSVGEILDLYDHLHPSIDCKLVRATDVPGDEVSPATFDRICHQIVNQTSADRLVRISDTAERACSLRERGFFSIRLPNFGYTACCVAVDKATTRLDPRKPDEFVAIVDELLQPAGSDLREAPCGTGSAHCPLALREAAPTNRRSLALVGIS